MVDQLRTMTVSPPHSLEAERSLLAGVSFEPDCMPMVAQKITSEACFYAQPHRHIWKAMRLVVDRGAEINETSVRDALETAGHDLAQYHELDAAVCDIFDRVVMATEREEATAVVRKHAVQRRALSALAKVCDGISRKALDPEGVAEKLVRVNQGLARDETEEDPSHPKVVARKMLNQWERVLQGKGTQGYDTGIVPIDLVLDTGFQPGFNHVFGAYSGHGKTTVMSAVAAALAERHGAIVNFHPYEIGQIFQAARVIAAKHGKRHRTTLKEHRILWPDKVPPGIEKEYRAEMMDAIAWFKDSGIYIEEPGVIDVRFVEMRIRALRAEFPDRPLVLVIDYMQHLTQGDWSENKQDRISNGSSRLISLCKQTNTVLLQATQFTGGDFNNAPIAMPDPQDARHCKDIRDDADVFMSYLRPWPYDGKYAGRAILSKRKDRWGQPCAAAMQSDGQHNTFEMAGNVDWLGDVPNLQAPFVNEGA